MTSLVLLFVALSATVTPEELEQADKLVREGAAFGKEGNFRQAILYFKSAEELAPRATHDCNIGLAYARWEHYPEALYYLQRCRARAGEGLPVWVDERMTTTLTLLRHGRFAEVDIAVGPMPRAGIVFDALAAEEVFQAPIKIWLPLGRITVNIEAPGFKPLTRDLLLEHTGAQPFHFILEPEAVRENAISVVPPTKLEAVDAGVQHPGHDKVELVQSSNKGELEQAPLLEKLSTHEEGKDVKEKSESRWLSHSVLLFAALGAGASVWQGVEAHRQNKNAAKAGPDDALKLADASKKAALRADLASAATLAGLGFYFVLRF